MLNAGIVIILGALIVSMGIALYAYYIYQPNFKNVDAGEPIVVGTVEYIITYEGQFDGDEDTRPEHSFLKIRIDAKNLEEAPTQISGIQFTLINENGTRTAPVYGEFSDEDLLYHTMGYNKPVTYTTQFDVPFDEDDQYKIGIEPRKEQSSIDIGIVCILNC